MDEDLIDDKIETYLKILRRSLTRLPAIVADDIIAETRDHLTVRKTEIGVEPALQALGDARNYAKKFLQNYKHA